MHIELLDMLPPKAPLGRHDFLHEMQPHGVIDVAETGPTTMYILLRDDVAPDQLRDIREIAREEWPDHRVLLAFSSKHAA